ncbi:hypothetical protein Cgig2_004879 [Carnegiea gigantea]|uniref:F-box domain-containing protein n=1 Tax=Carnegiea gigantea TaxID=171969 RepID=A0A9Q1Q5R3_9CARY|nr:hypothetical protein Cgig2_004879 [Carnegiea gigantea]
MEGQRWSSSNVKYLPTGLVTEILARLPVKSLLRFRCVCKSWHSLISSLDFAYLHLAHYHDDDDDNTPILTFICHENIVRWNLRSTHTFRNVASKDCRNLPDNGCKCPENYFICGHSVNGLLLLSNSYLSYKTRRTEIMLWNPLIGKAHKLPSLEVCDAILGLGVDLSNNDYKVVAIANYPCTSVHLYTLSTHTWRSIVDYEESMISLVLSHGLLIQGTVFWVTVEYEGNSYMVSLDVKDEVFDYTTLPFANSGSSRCPVAYREQVGLLDLGGAGNYSCTLWVTEKDQTPRNWSKLYTINLQQHYFHKILCFKKNGQLIFTARGVVKLCNIETQDMKHLMKNRSFYHHWSSTSAYFTLYKERLGFDLSNNDYKVVVIAKNPSISVNLYTLGTDTWRSVVNHRESSINGVNSLGVLINGTIF